MVFVSSIDVTFSWLVSTPILRWVALLIRIFHVVDGEWVLLVIVDDYSCSCGFCAYVICALTYFVGLVAYACLEVCLSSFDPWGELAPLIEFGAWFNLPWFEGELVIHLSFREGMVFCIEKPHVLVAALLSWKFGVCHPYGLVWGGLDVVSCIFVSFALHTHLSHFASPVILVCICLIKLIIVLGWVVMRCETLLLDHAR
jgi:hypothetical protein